MSSKINCCQRRCLIWSSLQHLICPPFTEVRIDSLGTEFLLHYSNNYFLICIADPGFNFDSLLFYGSGWGLFQFDLLVFAVIDLLSESYVLAAVVAFIIGWSLRMLRDSLGRRNLGKKTLVDERFLI